MNNTPPVWINADLHCHSAVSDGTLQPEVLAARAKANGVELWALTDHDEVGGQQRARDAALALGLPYLTGTEISVTFADITVHIVGLGFDADNEALKAGLAATRGGRRERAMEMAEGLAKVGIKGEESTFTMTVDKKPVKAGIDPLNKLIDRRPGDNAIVVTPG